MGHLIGYIKRKWGQFTTACLIGFVYLYFRGFEDGEAVLTTTLTLVVTIFITLFIWDYVEQRKEKKHQAE